VARFDDGAMLRAKSASGALHTAIAAPPPKLAGIFRINKGLCEKLGIGCVLFVQHPSKKAPISTFPGGSFIACAWTFGNCECATEGGIPKSSRTGHSLKSLAFSGCVRRREVA
jgi:hypothetical protein